jgi:hypothetical protein
MNIGQLHIKDINGQSILDLQGNPRQVWCGDLDVHSKNLTSLKGVPVLVNGYFSCRKNELKSLDFLPLTVNKCFYCCVNRLNHLKDIHLIIKEIGGQFNALNNPIESNILGVLLIKGVKKFHIDNEGVKNIVNKYLPNDMSFGTVIRCASELRKAGFYEYAKL